LRGHHFPAQSGLFMRYEGRIYRPPSEARSYILQASVGCSWNKCTYCDMYRDKQFRVRELPEILEDLEFARRALGPDIVKIFVADGDALVMPMSHWRGILTRAAELFVNLRQLSCYAMASNVQAKTAAELSELRELGLRLLYIGPESGDAKVLQRIAKGCTFDDHVEAAQMAKAAGMKTSVIFLLGAGGISRSAEHASASAELATAMDPEFLSVLTLTVIPGTPIAGLVERGRFELPEPMGLLRELRTIVAKAKPTRTVFRTNHASNYLPIAGNLPRDREKLLAVIDAALAGKTALRPEDFRGL